MRDSNKYQTISELVEAVRVEIAKVEVMELGRDLRLKFSEDFKSQGKKG